ncbi:MAG: hypothetical protein AAF226_16990, partial [Verrucomicrobiota bacterium]
GWEVDRVAIGFGPVWSRIQLFGIATEFRAIPISGYAVPRMTTLSAPRLKSCLIYAAGPGVEILLVVGLLAVFGLEKVLSRPPEIIPIAITTFSFAALLGAGLNLIPIVHKTEAGKAASDGLGMILSWKMTDAEIKARYDADSERHSTK